MFNQEAAAAIAAGQIHDGHLKPIYDGYGFAQIPQTILHATTGIGPAGLPEGAWGDLQRRWDKVIVLLIDAFGLRQMERYADKYPFLRRFYDQGVVSPVTSQFPSTTTAHVTTMYTGQPVGQHGFYEWFTYEPLLGRVIIPLLSSEATDNNDRNALSRTGMSAAELYPLPSFASQLKAHGVTQYAIVPYSFLPSMYNDAMSDGATVIPRITFSEGLQTMTELVQRVASPAMFFYYFAEIDTLAHRHGPESSAVDAEADTLFTALENLLFKPLAGREDTLILLTADHGQIRSNPEQPLLVNKLVPELAQMIRRAPDGSPIGPAGSPRDLFLHIQPDAVADAVRLLTDATRGAAEVFDTRELMDKGYFGPVGQRLRDRIGEVAVLGLDDVMVWYGEKEHIPPFYGMHGGLAPGEMLTHVSLLPLG